MRLTALLVLVCALLASCAPARLPQEDSQVAVSRVLDAMRVFRNETESQRQSVIIFIHGASDRSWHQEYERWVNRMTAEGYAVVALDLYAGRSVSGSAARSGGFVPQEAVGDLMITLDWLQSQAWADQDNIFAIGSSFGGAVIMDALVFSNPARSVPAISSAPQSAMNNLTAGILMAPLCMEDVFGVRIVEAVYSPFFTHKPVLAIIPGADTVSDVEACRVIFNREAANGSAIEVIEYAGAGHTFMAQTDDYGDPSPDYNQTDAEDAWSKIFQYLSGF